MYKSLKTNKTKEQNERLEQLNIAQFFFVAQKYSGYKMHPKHATDLVEKNAAPYNSILNLSACPSDVHLVD